MEQFEIYEALSSEVDQSHKKTSKKSQKSIKRKHLSLVFLAITLIFLFFCGVSLTYKYFELEPSFLSSKNEKKAPQQQNNNEVIYRLAEKEDIPFIFQFIHDLAEYEKLSNDVTATEEALHEWIFEKKHAEVLLVIENGIPVGHAFYFFSFSAFIAKPIIFLDNLYVMPEHRGKKYGEGLLQRLAKIAVERGCGRLEWRCLTWNTPSYGFYESLGAKPLIDYVGFRVEGEILTNLANLYN